MKKLKANTVLSAFIFGVSILILCSFGTDTAYIILSRYKLQKITDAVALEYAATRGRDINYMSGSETDCNTKVRQKFEHIYNTLGSGTLAFNIAAMKEKNNEASKETLVKVNAQAKIMPAFLRFVGAREIILHANAYAKTNMIEVRNDIPIILPGRPYDTGTTFTSFGPDFTDVSSGRKTAMVTSKAGFNGDFAIDFAYQMPDDTDFVTGSGFFIFAGYETGGEIHWVDVGNKVKRVNPSDPAISYERVYYRRDISPDSPYFYCVNAIQNDGRTAKTMTFELSLPDDENAKGHINRFNYLRIYKAGAIAGTSIDGVVVNNVNKPCSLSFITSPPTMPHASRAAGSGYAPASIAYAAPIAYALEAPADDPIGGDLESGSTTVPISPEPNIFNTPSRVRLIILNNVSLINASEYGGLSVADEKVCSAH